MGEVIGMPPAAKQPYELTEEEKRMTPEQKYERAAQLRAKADALFAEAAELRAYAEQRRAQQKPPGDDGTEPPAAA